MNLIHKLINIQINILTVENEKAYFNKKAQQETRLAKGYLNIAYSRFQTVFCDFNANRLTLTDTDYDYYVLNMINLI